MRRRQPQTYVVDPGCILARQQRPAHDRGRHGCFTPRLVDRVPANRCFGDVYRPHSCFQVNPRLDRQAQLVAARHRRNGVGQSNRLQQRAELAHDRLRRAIPSRWLVQPPDRVSERVARHRPLCGETEEHEREPSLTSGELCLIGDAGRCLDGHAAGEIHPHLHELANLSPTGTRHHCKQSESFAREMRPP